MCVPRASVFNGWVLIVIFIQGTQDIKDQFWKRLADELGIRRGVGDELERIRGRKVALVLV